ncbi:ZIP family metal transporter [Methanocella sp. CWC-04]|uniref:ZIP family metal transporter n=1 Tax=Methanooceanicella nereidis TaxID=2052831 RepID=A0AAP2RAZ1_9EURY|nr:ZIP family metal transporter [Methanocella sp. CWC-04]MCD1294211.1 ZIP family metal transporter [Methanocella sp. CWC-04]
MLDILKFMETCSPITQTLIGTTYLWIMTAAGAATVFLPKKIDRKMLGGLLGFAGGVMLAASFWSLLLPAIEVSRINDVPVWMPVLIGFSTGAVFLWGIDKALIRFENGYPFKSLKNGDAKHSINMLFIGITLHNIPEGLAIGVAFASAAAGIHPASLAGAILLTIGIGIQDLPEGIAVSMPLYGEGMSRLRSFWYGQITGFVEVLAGLVGAATIFISLSLLPYVLGFAAGAMVYIVVEEIIPESKKMSDSKIPTIGFMIGFAVMMLLDVAFS